MDWKTTNKQLKAIALNREYQLLALIVLFGVALSLSLMKGVSFYGDDISYTAFVPSVLNGTFSENINIFSLRLGVLYPLAASIAIFGYNDLGAGAWALFAYAITMVIIYLIGKELHGGKAGLLSAALFAVYPLALKFNTSPDPMLPLVMFLSLSMLLFVYGRKSRKIGFFILSGISAFVGTLINPLAYLYFVFYAFYIVAEGMFTTIKTRKVTFDYAAVAVFIGLLTGIAIMGYINIPLAHGKPFFEINMTNNYYSAAGGPDQIFYTNPSLTFYIDGYFPYGFVQNLIVPLIHLNVGSFVRNARQLFESMFSLYDINLNSVGLFSYAVVLAGIWLLAINDKKSRFMLLWGAFLVGYMEFGSMSVTHYFPIYKLMRFTAIAAAPLMLILGAALSEFISHAKRKRGYEKNFRIIIVIAIIVFLFATSYQIDNYYYLFNHNSMQYVKTVASELKSISPAGSVDLYAPALVPYYIQYYMGYPATMQAYEYDNGAYGGLFMPSCSDIPSNSYLLIPSASAIETINSYNLWSINETWAYDPSECNLTLVADNYANVSLQNLQILDPTYGGNLYYNK